MEAVHFVGSKLPVLLGLGATFEICKTTQTGRLCFSGSLSKFQQQRLILEGNIDGIFACQGRKYMLFRFASAKSPCPDYGCSRGCGIPCGCRAAAKQLRNALLNWINAGGTTRQTLPTNGCDRLVHLPVRGLLRRTLGSITCLLRLPCPVDQTKLCFDICSYLFCCAE